MIVVRWGRVSLIAVACLGVLLLVAALALPRFVDVDQYRPLVAAKVREATGRSVSLGRISFTLLPSPGFTVRSLKVASARDPERTSDLMAESLTIRLELLGLLRGRLSVGSISLDEPVLVLFRDARGRWSFEDILERAAAARPPEAAPRETPIAVSVRRAVVRNGKILVYDDAVQPGVRSRAVLGPIDAVIEGWGAGEETRLDLSIGLGQSRVRADARLGAQPGGPPILRLAARSKSLRAEDLIGIVPWIGVAHPRGMKAGGTIQLDGEATIPIEEPEKLRFKGELRLAGVSYRDATMTRPVEGISGRVSVDGDRAVWRDFSAKVGSSSLQGGLQVEGFLKPRVGFALTSSRLDLNEIISTLTPAPSAGAPQAGRTPATPSPASEGPGLLGEISGNGTVAVKTIRFLTFDLADVQASARCAGGVFSLERMRAAFYGGSLSGSAEVALGAREPRYAMGVRLDKVDLSPLLAAYDPALKDLLRGRLTGGLELAAEGTDMQSILARTRGTGSLEVSEGTLTSIDVLKQLAALLELAGGKGIGKDETPFEYLRASLEIADRKARTEDMILHSADLDLEGKGWFGLDATMDLDVTARFSEDSTRGMVTRNARLGSLADRGRLIVYFNLSGALAAPRFRLDSKAQARLLGDKTQERAKEKLRDRLRDRILKHLGEEKPGEEQPGKEQPGEEVPPGG
jgi:uncharacterized protein involved in outer membrane biogenesis